MKGQSKKRRKIIADMKAEREAFVFEFMRCMICGPEWRRKFPSVLDIHEIARGGSRERAYQDRRAWLLLCRDDHESMDDAEQWPVVRQYALKQLRDPKFYDRIWLNQCRDRADDAITEEEVADQLARLIQLGF